MLILGIGQCLHRICGKILHSSAGKPILARKLVIDVGKQRVHIDITQIARCYVPIAKYAWHIV